MYNKALIFFRGFALLMAIWAIYFTITTDSAEKAGQAIMFDLVAIICFPILWHDASK